MSEDLPVLTLDRSKLQVFSSFDEAEADAIEFWRNTSHEERLEYLYRLRYMAYGDKIRGSIQRVLEVAEQT